MLPKISLMGDMEYRAIKIGYAISKFFHCNRISPNVMNLLYNRAMVSTIAKVGPGVKPPSAYEISKKFLDKEIED